MDNHHDCDSKEMPLMFTMPLHPMKELPWDAQRYWSRSILHPILDDLLSESSKWLVDNDNNCSNIAVVIGESYMN